MFEKVTCMCTELFTNTLVYMFRALLQCPLLTGCRYLGLRKRFIFRRVDIRMLLNGLTLLQQTEFILIPPPVQAEMSL